MTTTALWANIANADGTSPYQPGTFHLRVHPQGSGTSRTADLAAIADWSTNDTTPTLFAAHTGPAGLELSKMAGRGWRDELLTIEHAAGMLAATAALYRLWAATIRAGRDRCMLIVESISDVTSGPSDAVVDDDANVAWLSAICFAGVTNDDGPDPATTLAALRDLTGLSFEHHQGFVPDRLPRTCVVAGVRARRRRDATTGPLAAMGSFGLVALASSIVEFSDIAGGVDAAGQSQATATVTTLKHRSFPAAVATTVTRSFQGEMWHELPPG